MERTEPHIFEEAPAPEARDERPTEAYEPPSLTELGSFLELTVGTSGAGIDTDTVSTAQ
jgi:hypothetical protein